MIETEPNVNPKGKYELKAASEALEISRTSLARYTKRGLIRCSVSSLNGRNTWLGSELIKFWRLQK